MATRIQILALLAGVVFSGTSSVPFDQPAPADAAVIEWAETRFAGSGLIAPEVEVAVFTDLRDCGGHVGMYYPGRRLLELCRVDEKSVLHELAHAWADQSLDDATRQAFVAHRGAGGWNDRSDAWNMRATEHAAEIIVWALMDRETTHVWIEDGAEERRLITIPDSSPERLAAGFSLLTGQTIPQWRTLEAPPEPADFSPEARRP